MTNDEILKVARECGLPREVVTYRFDQIITFAHRIAAMQRSETADWLLLTDLSKLPDDWKMAVAALINGYAIAIREQSDE